MAKAVFDKGPLTYSANVNIRESRLVMPDGVTARIKETDVATGVTTCLGVATGNAAGIDFRNTDTRDPWGATIVNAQYPPNEVAVAYQGVWRLWVGGVEEVQTLTLGTGVVTFTLTIAGETTTALPRAATAAQVQAALDALEASDVGDIVVTGSAATAFTFTFGGRYADANVPALVGTQTPTVAVDATSTLVVATTTPGGDVLGIAFGVLVMSGEGGTVRSLGANTLDKVVGRCVEPGGIVGGARGKILLGGIGA